MDKLKRVVLDVEKGTVTINDVELLKVSYFKLEFKGHWTLTTTEDFLPRGEKIAPNE